MRLKRRYDIPEGWEPERSEDGTLTNPLPIAGIDVQHTGVDASQNFSRRVVDAGVQQGWLTLSKGKLILHTNQEDLVYTVARTPGLYCCHCGASLGEDATGQSGQEHVRAMHKDEPSPDPSNPAGYRRTHAYECTLDHDQHVRWQRPAGATVSGWRGGKQGAAAPGWRGDKPSA